jgi:hypothetical protein
MDATVMRAALLIAIALLSGCMKIYTDSEKPDLRVHWDDNDCRPETPNVKLVLSLPDDTLVEERIVPCTDVETTFVDVTPDRYELRSWLLLADGETFSSWYSEPDMRDAFSADEYLYFGGSGNLRVAWTFSMDATCRSIGADYILIDLDYVIDGSTGGGQFTALCDPSPWVGYALGDMVYVTLRAVDDETFTVRAVSETAGPFSADADTLTNVGTITLTPCSDCD